MANLYVCMFWFELVDGFGAKEIILWIQKEYFKIIVSVHTFSVRLDLRNSLQSTSHKVAILQSLTFNLQLKVQSVLCEDGVCLQRGTIITWGYYK